MPRLMLGAIALSSALLAGSANAGDGDPYADMIVQATPHDFDTLWTRVEEAVLDQEMRLLGSASAGRGVEIPGDGVIDVFRNDFAVRMLAESIAAGFEAPIRFYLTENPDGTTILYSRPPRAVFAPYDNPKLDDVFSTIAAAVVAE